VSKPEGGTTRTRVNADGPDFATGVGGVSVAIGISAVGAVAVAVGPALGVVTSASGAAQGAQPAAATLTGVLALVVPLLAALLLRGGRVLGSIGVLSGGAAAGIGAAVLDVQLFTGPIDANRFELFRPTSAATLHAGTGAVVVVVGQMLVVLAGALALWTMHRSALLDDPDGFDVGLLGGGEEESRGTSLAGRCGRRMSTVTGVAAVVAAAALFAPPLVSADPVVLVSAVVESARPVLVGTALLAIAVLVVVALALVSTSVPAGAGAVAGVALGALGVFGPRLVAAGLLDRISVGVGSLLGTVAALVLLGCAAVLARSSRPGLSRAPAPVGRTTEVRLPGAARLHLLTAVLGLLGGLAAVLAALLPILSTPAGVAQPQIYPARVLLLAGVLLAAVCAGMVTGPIGPLLRPVVAILWVAPVLGASGVLQAVLVATAVPGVGAGPGAWVTVLAVLLAAGCGIGAGLAGAVERDDVDTSGEYSAGRAVTMTAAVAAGAALLGLALPLYSGSGVTAAALASGAWGWDSWGLAVVLVAVLGVLAVAVRARPARGLALLVGVELVLIVHLVSWPLTAARLSGSTVGIGAGFTVIALLAVPTTAVLLRREQPS
jgi:hypothetical protein